MRGRSIYLAIVGAIVLLVTFSGTAYAEPIGDCDGGEVDVCVDLEARNVRFEIGDVEGGFDLPPNSPKPHAEGCIADICFVHNVNDTWVCVANFDPCVVIR